jgi:hypothetical protein
MYFRSKKLYSVNKRMCKVQPYTYVEIFLVCDAVAVMDSEAVHEFGLDI